MSVPLSPDQLSTLAACGAYDPDAPWAADRLEALELLVERGASVEDLCGWAGQLGSLAGRLSLRPGGNVWTRDEVAARAGVSPDLIARVWRASGFAEPGPDALVAGPDDIAVFQAFAASAELFGEDAVLQMTRVIGASAARLADTMVSAFVVNLGARAAADPSGLSMVRANLEAVSLIEPVIGAIDQLLRMHMVLASRPVMLTGDEPIGVEVQILTVGFLDLVGSTALADEQPFADLAAVISEFETRASDTVVSRGGRVIKLIGDEVMFTAPDAGAAADAALDVRDALAGHPVLRGLRGGLATGRVLVRDGDCFGPVVNLAARLAKHAPVNEIVVDPAVAAALAQTGSGERLAVEPLGAWQLDGFAEAVAAGRLTRAPSLPSAT